MSADIEKTMNIEDFHFSFHWSGRNDSVASCARALTSMLMKLQRLFPGIETVHEDQNGVAKCLRVNYNAVYRYLKSNRIKENRKPWNYDKELGALLTLTCSNRKVAFYITIVCATRSLFLHDSLILGFPARTEYRIPIPFSTILSIVDAIRQSWNPDYGVVTHSVISRKLGGVYDETYPGLMNMVKYKIDGEVRGKHGISVRIVDDKALMMLDGAIWRRDVGEIIVKLKVVRKLLKKMKSMWKS